MVPLADDFNHLMFICDLLTQPENVETLHLRTIPKSEYKRFYQEMKAALLHGADDESNYMIRKGVVPIGWLKVKDECGDSLRISMLIVHEKYRNLGAGTFALQFAEEMAAANQYSHINVQITSDNVTALAFYQKNGYGIIGEERCQNEDDTESVRDTLQKEIREGQQ